MSVTQWFIKRVTDLLIAFAVATVLLFVGAVNYPAFFPQQFFHYWTLAKPDVALAPSVSVENTRQSVSVITQVQR